METEATKMIEALDAASVRAELPRKYIGASIIGAVCDAQIAYSLRGFPNVQIPPRVKRIFDFGHWIEEYIVQNIISAHYKVEAVDPATYKQWHFSPAEYGGHVQCNLDGVIYVNGIKMNLEIKSMNDDMFKTFVRKGIKYSHTHYYLQAQMAHMLSGMEHTFLVAMNKDTCHYHAEVIHDDLIEHSYIRLRIERAMTNTAARVAEDETDWRCRECPKAGVCWGEIEVVRLCSRCQFSLPAPDRKWYCTKHNIEADLICEDYQEYKPLNKGELP
jgi:hypothetical protein